MIPGACSTTWLRAATVPLTRLAVLTPAAFRPATVLVTNSQRAASTSVANAFVAAYVVRTGRPAGIAAAADRAMEWAAVSMAEFRLAAAWPALIGFIPACTNTLASMETDVLEPSARAMLPTDPAATQRPVITAPSWRRRREKRDRCIEVPFWLGRPRWRSCGAAAGSCRQNGTR